MPDPSARHLAQLEARIAELELELKTTRERTSTLELETQLLHSQLEAAIDGILVVDSNGKIVFFNRRFMEMWHLGSDLVATGSDDTVLDAALRQLVDPDAFLARVRELYEHPDEHSREELVLTNGCLFERYSSPVRHDDGSYIGRIWWFRDISERHHTEQLLDEKTRALAAFFDINTDLLCIADKNGNFVRLNPQWERTFGYSLRELEGQPYLQFVHPDDLPATVRVTEAAAQGVQPGFVHRVRCRDGSYRWLEWRSRPGGPWIYATARDITEQKAAEAALRRERDLVQRLMATSPVGLLSVNGDGKLGYVNAQARGILGVSDNASFELEQASTIHFYDPEGRPIDENDMPFQRVRRMRCALYGMRFSIRRVDRIPMQLSVNAAPLLAEDGEFDGMILALEDVTQRKQAEQALKASEERLRRLVETAPVAIVGLDASLRIVDVNPRAQLLVGRTRAELLGTLFVDTFAQGSSRSSLALLLLESYTGHFGISKEVQLIEDDGGERSVEWNMAPLTLEDNSRGLICVGVDVTDHRRLEGQLRQAQKMEAVGRLAGGVAHDFNNLLTGISGHLALAIMDTAPESPVLDLLEEASKAADSAAILTRQLLAFSRRQVIEPHDLCLNDLLGRLHRMLQRLLGEDILHRFEPDPELWRCRIDANQLEQTIINLAVNARDAMPNGGSLTISTRNAVLDVTDPRCPNAPAGQYAQVRISDTGCGMSADVRRHLFEPFFTTKGPGKGTGLGLATVYGAVQQNGGYIQVTSVEGRGTDFDLFFPRITASEPTPIVEPPPLEHQELSGGTETLLVVEDSQPVASLVGKLLVTLGYKVRLCSNGTEALSRLTEDGTTADLLLTDVVMPGMNGRELAERVRSLCPTIKILFTSGYAEDILARQGVLAKGIQFIGKPYSLQGLATKLRLVLHPEPSPAKSS